MADLEIINETDIKRRKYWVAELKKISGHFGNDSLKLEDDLKNEIEKDGIESLISHLRLCGAIPEEYRHDSTEEKLYSKYTDMLISHAFTRLGIISTVLKERADVADVEGVTPNYSFVADAKAFRLSRTAKNQKDFKIQAMDNWKHGKTYAIVVCPIYQLPSSQSQIYQQAVARDVCIFSYNHLSVLVQYANIDGEKQSQDLLLQILKCINQMMPTKSSTTYWKTVNNQMLSYSNKIQSLWSLEKKAYLDSIVVVKEEALTFMSSERERIMKLSKTDAIKQLLNQSKINSKIRKINSFSDNGLMAYI